MAATPVRDISTRPSGRIRLMKALTLSVDPVTSKTKDSVLCVDHPGAENIGDAQRLDAVVARALHLDQRQFALEMRALDGEVGDRVDRHQPVELVA